MKNSRNSNIARWLRWTTVVLALVAGPAFAFKWDPSQKDFAMLPEHCKAKLSDFGYNRGGQWNRRFPINERKILYYKELIGYDFRHMHHYCFGLNYISKAHSNRSRAHWNFSRAIVEIDYTLGKSSPSQPLWIEMNIAQARARAGLRKYGEAIKQLRACLELEPSSEALYIEIAKVQEQAGNLNDAIATLEAGMAKGGKPGPLQFWLASYYFELGDFDQAHDYMNKAEANGMKMNRLRRRLDGR